MLINPFLHEKETGKNEVNMEVLELKREEIDPEELSEQDSLEEEIDDLGLDD